MTDYNDRELTRDEERGVRVAEYVLGLGGVHARAAIAHAVDTDPAIAREASYWEGQFATFNDGYEPSAPPASTFKRIEARLFGKGEGRAPWYNSLPFWRTLAGAATAAALVAVGLNLMPLTPDQPRETTQLMAALQPVDSDLSFLARYDAALGELRLSGSGAPAGAGSDYELWFIEGENAPVSMGVLEVGEGQMVIVDPALREQFAQGITLAVTREVAGGSPTGEPGGPIVAAGPVAAI